MNKSKSLTWEEYHRSELELAGHEMESLLRNTDITTLYSKSGPAFCSPQGTSGTPDLWVGPVGTRHTVEDCRVLWKTGRRLQSIPRRASARPHANSLDPALHTAAPGRRGSNSTVWERMESASERRLPAGGRRSSGFLCKRLTNHSRKPNRSSRHCGRTRHLTHTKTPGRLHEGTCPNLLQPAPHIQEGRCTNTTLGATAQTGF